MARLLYWMTGTSTQERVESLLYCTTNDEHGETEQTINEEDKEYDSCQQTDGDVQGPVLEPVEAPGAVRVKMRRPGVTHDVVDPEPNPISRCQRLISQQPTHLLGIVPVSVTETINPLTPVNTVLRVLMRQRGLNHFE